MASARNSLPALRLRSMPTGNWTKLAIPAVILTLLCALCAFGFLVWRDQDHPKVMVNDQRAPARSSAKAASAAGATTQALASTQAPAPGKASEEMQSSNPAGGNFDLTGKSPTALLGTVKIRLLRTNSKRHSYDLSVQERGRARTHRNLRARQPLWIAGNRGETPLELIVSTIAKDSVSGYWREAGHSPETAARTGKR